MGLDFSYDTSLKNLLLLFFNPLIIQNACQKKAYRLKQEKKRLPDEI